MKRFLKYCIISNLSLLLIMAPNLAHAQLGDPGDDPDAPIDGGLSVLVAAGIGYGIKKARDSRKKNIAVFEKESDH